MIRRREQSFRSGDLTLRGTRWDGDSTRTVLLLHGLGFHRFEYERFAQLLAEAARVSCFAVDLRGHGRSDGARGRWRLADLVTDARRALDHLSADGRGPIGVLGNSMGALVGLKLAVADPRVRCVVACDCPTRVADFARTPWRSAALSLLSLVDHVVPVRISVNWFEPYENVLTDPAVRRRVAADALVTAARRLSPGTYRDLLAWSALDAARSIDVPVLVLAATRDRLQPLSQAEMLVEALPRPTSLRLLDAGHVPNLEVPDLVVQAVADWIDRNL